MAAPSSAARDLRRDAAAAAALFLGTVLLFAPAVGFGFVDFDDGVFVARNEAVRAGLTPSSVAWAFRTHQVSQFHPLTWLSYMLDTELFGTGPAGYHATNVALFGAAVALLFLALRRLTGEAGPSAVVAVLFAVHPLRVESVAWVAERKDVLSLLLGLACLLAYAGHARRPSPGRYALVALLLTLAILAKPMMVTLPCVMLLLDLWPLGRVREGRTVRLVAEKLPLLAIAVGLALLSWEDQQLAIKPLETFPLPHRLGNVLLSYVWYLDRLVLPRDLAFFYPHAGRLDGLAVAGAAFLLAALSALAAAARHRRPYLLVGWLWYLGTLVPVIGFVQVGDQAVADRYSLLPSIGLLVAIVWGLARATEARPALRRIVVAGAVLQAGLFAWLTRSQLPVWKDSETLFRHALAVTRDNDVAHNNLANLLARRGRLAEAEVHYREAIRIDPPWDYPRLNLATLLRHTGRRPEALTLLLEGVRLRPTLEALRHAASALEEAGRPSEALDLANRALLLAPDDAALREQKRRLEAAAPRPAGIPADAKVRQPAPTPPGASPPSPPAGRGTSRAGRPAQSK